MMEKLLGKKWFSRDNLLLLVLLGVLLFVIALPVKKEDSGKGQEKENATAMLEEVPASTQTVTAGSTEEYAAYLEEKLKNRDWGRSRSWSHWNLRRRRSWKKI